MSAIDREDLQTVLLGFAHVAYLRPGWDFHLTSLAGKFGGDDAINTYQFLKGCIADLISVGHKNADRILLLHEAIKRHLDDVPDHVPEGADGRKVAFDALCELTGFLQFLRDFSDPHRPPEQLKIDVHRYVQNRAIVGGSGLEFHVTLYTHDGPRTVAGRRIAERLTREESEKLAEAINECGDRLQLV